MPKFVVDFINVLFGCDLMSKRRPPEGYIWNARLIERCFQFHHHLLGGVGDARAHGIEKRFQCQRSTRKKAFISTAFVLVYTLRVHIITYFGMQIQLVFNCKLMTRVRVCADGIFECYKRLISFFHFCSSQHSASYLLPTLCVNHNHIYHFDDESRGKSKKTWTNRPSFHVSRLPSVYLACDCIIPMWTRHSIGSSLRIVTHFINALYFNWPEPIGWTRWGRNSAFEIATRNGNIFNYTSITFCAERSSQQRYHLCKLACRRCAPLDWKRLSIWPFKIHVNK